MNRTKIEWCDYTWNPVKGECPQGCWYCYMKGINRRFKRDPRLRFDPIEATGKLPQKPSRIFVGSTIDLFHPQIPNKWIIWPIHVAELKPQHTFIFLTKNPARYAEFDFPKNCWLGITETDRLDAIGGAVFGFNFNKNLRFVSYEPLLGDVKIPAWANWIIVGAMTGPKSNLHQPKKEWIEFILKTAKALEIPIFMKNNLKKVWGKKLIQEFPK